MKRVVQAEVAIVGFGPIGMVMAGLLAQRGIKVLAFDKSHEVFPLPRAAHMDHTTLRTIQELGLVDNLLPQVIPNTALVLMDDQLEPLVNIPAPPYSRSGYPSSVYFYQPEFDRYLQEGVSRFENLQILRGYEVSNIAQTDDEVRFDAISADEQLEVHAQWVIGSDGSRSTVREAMNTTLVSLNFDEQWLVLDLQLESSVFERLPEFAQQICNPERSWVSNPVPGNRYRVEIKLAPDDDPKHLQTPGFLRNFLQPLLEGADCEIERNAVYFFHGLVAEDWRRGRLILAGDAAHQMPPFLGQGMVSGIRDAQNLAWKLAGVIQGEFPEEILDTYQEERSPHVTKITASAIEIGRFVTANDREEVERRNAKLRGGDYSDAPSFSIPPLESGSLVSDSGGELFPQFRAVEAPDGRLDDILGTGWNIILGDGQADIDEVAEAAQGIANINIHTLQELNEESLDDWFRRHNISFAIVRPDKYIYASQGNVVDQTKTLAHILSTVRYS